MGARAGFERPGGIEVPFNELPGKLAGRGIGPGHVRLLEVPGRRSGRIYATPADPLDLGAGIEAFDAIAENYPVFRLDGRG